MANEIVKQHNDFIDLPLRKFNSSEIDILMAICYKAQGNDTNEVVLDFSDIKKLAHYKNKNEKQFLADLKRTNEKLMSLNFTIGDEKNFIQFVLFPTFKVSSTNGTLTIKVNEQFAYLLNDLTGNYTALELQESSSLKSSYAKNLYKKLREFRLMDKPLMRMPIADFREYLDIPKSYSISNINDVVIKPSTRELSAYFEGLKCEAYYEKNTGKRGRPKVAGFEFTFKSQKTEKFEKPVSVEKIAEKTNWQKIGKYCPVCHKEVYQKQMENENGMYFLIGHPDFRTGNCSWTSTSYEELLSASDLQRMEEAAALQQQFTDEQRQQNKKTLADKLKNIFG